jgi:hypothetical protein
MHAAYHNIWSCISLLFGMSLAAAAPRGNSPLGDRFPFLQWKGLTLSRAQVLDGGACGFSLQLSAWQQRCMTSRRVCFSTLLLFQGTGFNRPPRTRSFWPRNRPRSACALSCRCNTGPICTYLCSPSRHLFHRYSSGRVEEGGLVCNMPSAGADEGNMSSRTLVTFSACSTAPNAIRILFLTGLVHLLGYYSFLLLSSESSRVYGGGVSAQTFQVLLYSLLRAMPILRDSKGRYKLSTALECSDPPQLQSSRYLCRYTARTRQPR